MRTLGVAARIAGILPLYLGLGFTQLFGQGTNAGSVTGMVTDSSGAVIVGASVSLLNPATHDKLTTVTTKAGDYVFPLVKPATYNVSAESPGFKTVVRENLIVQVAEKVRVDFTLEPGAVTQMIEVKAASPLLQPETSSLGTVVAENAIKEIPLNGRNVYELVKLVPGVSPMSAFGAGGLPVGGTGLNQIMINGGRNLTNQFMFDDVENRLMGFNAVGAVPILDSVQEFNVLTNSFSAKYGRTGGGFITAVTKSGTNDFHVSAWEFLRNRALDAQNFFLNKNGQKLSQFQQNQYGATGGGRIRRDKTFFFGAFEGFRQTLGGQVLTTVPTDLEKKGDFSQTFGLDGNLLQIFNPFTTRPANGSLIRDQFSGNVIPQSSFDPVAMNLLQFFPEPNLPGDPFTHALNFLAQAPNHTSIDRFQVRIDHNFSERQRFFGRFYYDRQHFTTGNALGNIADPNASLTDAFTKGLALQYTNTLSPTSVLNIRYGLIRQPSHFASPSRGYDQTKLGFPASLVQQYEIPIFPRIDFNVGGFTSLGAQFFSNADIPATTQSLAASLSKVVGRHSIEAGIDLRLIQGALFDASWPGGQFQFDTGFTRGPDPTNPGADTGNSFASFLLGTVSNGANFAAYDPHWFFTNRYYAGYFQDDIKVSRKLTLNLGLRYDYESPLLDRHNQVSFVDFKSQVPISVTPVDVPGFGPLPKQPFIGGGAGFPGVNGQSRGAWLPRRKNFGPRVGLAYSIDSKTVIRTAYGIIYPGTTADNSGNFPTVQGFNPITVTILAPDGFTPIQRPDRGFLLSNPYPNGLIQPSGSSLGLLTSVGNRDVGLNHTDKYAYFQQWNFGIQRELPGNLLIEAAYVGSHSVHMADFLGGNFDALPDKYLSLENSLFNTYPNPFLDVLPASSTLGGQPTISLQQLLLPFPEFTSVATFPDHRTSSTYNGFQLKVQKRMSRGISFLASYTAAKTLDDDSATDGLTIFNFESGHQNSNNLRLDHSLNGNDRSQILVLSPIWELPFGGGKYFGSGLTNPVISHVISGWQVSSLLSFSTGFPVGARCAICTFPAVRPDLVGDPSAGISGSNESRLNRWFNTDAFAANQLFRYGTAPRLLPHTRGPGQANADFSIVKTTAFGERTNLQFRAEFFNFLNRPQFGMPDNFLGSPTYGEITSQVNIPRQIQFGLKLYW